jgi:tellurite resistance protein TerC
VIDILVFIAFVVIALAIDLYAHKKDEPIPLKSAAIWSMFWVAVAMLFAAYLYVFQGPEISSLFISGYVLEKTLSVDNLFVIAAIMSWFSIPDQYRHRILYWGVLGAIVFRLIFVLIGSSLLAFGPWVEMLFALAVAASAVMMLKGGDNDNEIEDYSEHLACRITRKFFKVYPKLYGSRFFVKSTDVEGVHDRSKAYWLATPLFLCVGVVELSDLMFAFDSVPAVIAVSREPLIIYSAMIFAILGLRTLYFVLEAMKDALVHLEKAVIVLLFYIAAKLALNASEHLFGFGYKIDPTHSLFIVLAILGVGIIASFLFSEKEDTPRNQADA